MTDKPELPQDVVAVLEAVATIADGDLPPISGMLLNRAAKKALEDHGPRPPVTDPTEWPQITEYGTVDWVRRFRPNKGVYPGSWQYEGAPDNYGEHVDEEDKFLFSLSNKKVWPPVVDDPNDPLSMGARLIVECQECGKHITRTSAQEAATEAINNGWEVSVHRPGELLCHQCTEAHWDEIGQANG